MPTLVAMARSGETFITRRERHGLWLHLPPGAGGAGPVDEAAAERAVADHGFLRFDQQFETWAELDDFRQQEAAKFAPPVVIDPAELDAEDVERMLGVARRWAADGEAGQSRRLLLRLLRVPVVTPGTGAHDQILAALEALGDPRNVVQLQPTDPLKVEARRRWADVVTAA